MRYLKEIIWMLLTGMIMTCTVLGQPEAPAQNDQSDKRHSNGQNDHRPPPAVPDSAQTVQLVDELSTVLSLTADEKQAVLELHVSHFARVKELMGQASSDRKSHRRQMDALHKELQDEMKALLSDKQFQKYEEFMKTHNSRSGRLR